MGVHLLFQLSVSLKFFKIKSLRKSITVLNKSKGLHPSPSHFSPVLNLGKLSNLLVAHHLTYYSNKVSI